MAVDKHSEIAPLILDEEIEVLLVDLSFFQKDEALFEFLRVLPHMPILRQFAPGRQACRGSVRRLLSATTLRHFIRYFVACCNAAGSSSKIHSITDTGRLPFLIRSSWN
jgi:hypothetical protein